MSPRPRREMTKAKKAASSAPKSEMSAPSAVPNNRPSDRGHSFIHSFVTVRSWSTRYTIEVVYSILAHLTAAAAAAFFQLVVRLEPLTTPPMTASPYKTPRSWTLRRIFYMNVCRYTMAE